MLDKAMAWFEHQCNQNKLIRRVLLVWVLWITTRVTDAIISAPPGMTEHDAKALGIVWAGAMLLLGYYFKRRADSDK